MRHELMNSFVDGVSGRTAHIARPSGNIRLDDADALHVHLSNRLSGGAADSACAASRLYAGSGPRGQEYLAADGRLREIGQVRAGKKMVARLGDFHGAFAHRAVDLALAAHLRPRQPFEAVVLDAAA
jgi:hypothetical protein